jgi:hypothetical protein
MPFDSNGNFTRTQNWTSDFENGIEIVCDRHDDEDDNFANGFNECMLRDGRAPATGNLKMGNFRITGMADGQTSNDAVNKGQLDAQNSSLTSLLNTTLATLYPIGSIYIGTQETCPLTTIISGSKWELVSEGKALWGGNGYNANNTIEAGLPNIEGSVTYAQGSYNSVGILAKSGAFNSSAQNVNVSSYNGFDDDVTKETTADKIVFMASDSNSIYGNSSTVQPPAYIVNIWRRTA